MNKTDKQEKQHIKNFIKFLREKQDEINNNNPYSDISFITLIAVFESVDKEYYEINPFRFDLRNGECLSENIETGKLKIVKFW